MSTNDAIFRSFKGILPVDLSDASLISSTIPEPDPARVMGDGSTGEVVYNAGETTTKNQRRILTSTHRVYRDSIGGTQTGSPDVNIERWVDEGPTNRWAWADKNNGTKSEATGSFSMVLAPRSITAIGLSGMSNVARVRLRIWDSDGGTLQVDRSYSMRDMGGYSPWWSWFFLKPSYLDRMLISDLPPHPNCRVELTFEAPGSTALQVGSATLGNWISFGAAEITVRAKPRDFGYSTTDDWGNSIDRPGPVAQDLSCRAFAPRAMANEIHRNILKTLRRRVFWVPSSKTVDRYLITDGILTSADIGPDNSEIVSIDFEIEGRT